MSPMEHARESKRRLLEFPLRQRAIAGKFRLSQSVGVLWSSRTFSDLCGVFHAWWKVTVGDVISAHYYANM